MRFSNIVSLALAAAPAAVFAKGTPGFSLGAQNPDGSCKQTTDYEKDFDALKAHTKLVRTYSADQCDTAVNILPAAKNKGFKVVLAVWPDVPDSFKVDVDALKKAVPGNEDAIEAITVGSESLYREAFTGPELLSKIQEVEKLFPKVRVGTADSWNKFADGTADALITGGVKYFLINAFAFWQGQDISNATATYFDDMMQAIGHIQDVAGDNAKDIHMANGETGWPTTGGTDYDAAKAGTENAQTFYKDGYCALLNWGVDAFYFEAFDEPFKPDSVGDNGESADETHWGAYTAERKAKFDLTC
ncbi:glycoside hydrolase 3 protein [Arachnomyces sp. PD_36]|nr:glycoside hydrolase 3 protein [Arachnomyces sp. PD_36]